MEIKKGWWIEERSIIPCALTADGLVVVYRREDAEVIFDNTYYHEWIRDTKVWYFNETLDREIAEIDCEGRISANPQTLHLFIRRVR